MAADDQRTPTLSPGSAGSVWARPDVETVVWRHTMDRLHTRGNPHLQTVLEAPDGAPVRLGLVEGTPLGDYVGRGLAPVEVSQLLGEISVALAHLHMLGGAHGAVNPATIRVKDHHATVLVEDALVLPDARDAVTQAQKRDGTACVELLYFMLTGDRYHPGPAGKPSIPYEGGQPLAPSSLTPGVSVTLDAVALTAAALPYPTVCRAIAVQLGAVEASAFEEDIAEEAAAQAVRDEVYIDDDAGIRLPLPPSTKHPLKTEDSASQGDDPGQVTGVLSLQEAQAQLAAISRENSADAAAEIPTVDNVDVAAQADALSAFEEEWQHDTAPAETADETPREHDESEPETSADEENAEAPSHEVRENEQAEPTRTEEENEKPAAGPVDETLTPATPGEDDPIDSQTPSTTESAPATEEPAEDDALEEPAVNDEPDPEPEHAGSGDESKDQMPAEEAPPAQDQADDDSASEATEQAATPCPPAPTEQEATEPPADAAEDTASLETSQIPLVELEKMNLDPTVPTRPHAKPARPQPSRTQRFLDHYFGDPPAASTLSEAEREPIDPQHAIFRWIGIGLAVAVVLAIAVLAWPMPKPTDPVAATPSQTHAPSTTPTPEELPAPHIAEVTIVDPQGDGAEHPELLAALTDEDAESTWMSRTYAVDTYGMKNGIGLLVTFKEKARLSAVVLDSRASGGTIQVTTGTPDNPTEGVVGEASFASGTVEIAPSEPVETDHVLVWVPKLPSDDATHALRVVLAGISLK